MTAGFEAWQLAVDDVGGGHGGGRSRNGRICGLLAKGPVKGSRDGSRALAGADSHNVSGEAREGGWEREGNAGGWFLTWEEGSWR
jgi:hypothetical protein